MPIDRINIQTTSFSLRATNIRGPQLRSLVDSLRRAAGTAVTPSRIAGPQVGPGAIQSPAERFPRIAPSSSGQAQGASDPSLAGFAPGGANQMQSLNPNGVLQLVMQLLERLLQAIAQMFGQGGAGGAGTDTGNSGGGGCQGAGQGAGGASGSGGSCGGGGATDATGGAGTGADTPPILGADQGGGAQPVPPRASPGLDSRRRPGASQHRRRGSFVKKFLKGLGKGAANVAPTLVPGGGAVASAIQMAQMSYGPSVHQNGGGGCPPPPPSCQTTADTPPRLGGGSLEDRIFEYLSSRLREVEGELESAMQKNDQSGGASGSGGDSRSAAAQKVQQLVQKRSEMVELLSNSLKTLHDSTMAVDRNIRS